MSSLRCQRHSALPSLAATPPTYTYPLFPPAQIQIYGFRLGSAIFIVYVLVVDPYICRLVVDAYIYRLVVDAYIYRLVVDP